MSHVELVDVEKDSLVRDINTGVLLSLVNKISNTFHIKKVVPHYSVLLCSLYMVI
jgi:hypothetical protein